MKCPYCGHENSRVIDSRELDDAVRRRRQCLACSARFTSYERVASRSLIVIKKDGRREEFQREKLATGIRKACEKRPLPTGTIDKVVEEIETELYGLGRVEVSSSLIGDKVMEKLKGLDHIAYVRFASVYRQFADLSDFREVVDSLASGEKPPAQPAAQLPLIPSVGAASLSKKKKLIVGRVPRGSRAKGVW